MNLPPNYIKELKERNTTPHIKHEWQEVGVQWQPYFKENIYSQLLNKKKKDGTLKYPLEKLKAAFRVCQKQEVYTIAYIVGVLNNLH